MRAATTIRLAKRFSPEQIFMLSSLIVNGGNYLYNLILGRLLGPTAFADAAILVTLLLVISFLAMTFQVAVAKFKIELPSEKIDFFIQWATKRALLCGTLIGIVIIASADGLQQWFQTDSKWMFVIFGLAIPVYFALSVRRGYLQGSNELVPLSLSYQLEMWSRLGITLLLIFILPVSPSIVVSIGIAISFMGGVFSRKNEKITTTLNAFSLQEKKRIRTFFILTAMYECTQIVCNNSDILLVKHYFDSNSAGLYASLALIGRVVYFVTWLFVMLLLPKVIEQRKQGQPTFPILKTYVGYTVLLSGAIVISCFLFPQLAVNLLFGSAYISIAPLLGWYAVATSLFAISNLFAYYFLSIEKYMPVIFTGVMGIVQVVLIMNYNEDLQEVVWMQIIAMGVLLILQLTYFFISHYKQQLSTHRTKKTIGR